MEYFKNKTFNHNLPLYIQLAAFIEEGINQKVFSSGFLPPERLIAKTLNLSRVTVSKALDLLVSKKLIVRQQGVGTKILSYLDYSLNLPLGFTERMLRKGYSVQNQWLAKETILCDELLSTSLELNIGEPVAYLKRIRLIENKPVSIETTYIPSQFLPNPERLEGSLYLYWQEQNIYIQQKNFKINAINCDEQTAIYLKQPANIALLKIQEISRNKDNLILELSDTLCLGNYYEFEISL